MQSGETADTLAALRLAKNKATPASLTICLMCLVSSLVSESPDLAFNDPRRAEIGVASTKPSLPTQFDCLLMLTLAIGQHMA